MKFRCKIVSTAFENRYWLRPQTVDGHTTYIYYIVYQIFLIANYNFCQDQKRAGKLIFARVWFTEYSEGAFSTCNMAS